MRRLHGDVQGEEGEGGGGVDAVQNESAFLSFKKERKKKNNMRVIVTCKSNFCILTPSCSASFDILKKWSS